MLVLQKIIKKSLFFIDFASSTFFPNLNASIKVLPLTNFHSKTIKRWNQSDLGYFYFHLNKAYDEGKIILVDKNV